MSLLMVFSVMGAVGACRCGTEEDRERSLEELQMVNGKWSLSFKQDSNWRLWVRVKKIKSEEFRYWSWISEADINIIEIKSIDDTSADIPF